jgi:hypothetical protein
VAGDSFDSLGALNQIVGLWQAVAGVQQVLIGAPESFPKRAFVYVTTGDQVVTDKTTQNLLTRVSNFFCGLSYRVDANLQTPELTIAGWIDAFLLALYTARATDGLGGTAKQVAVKVGMGDIPMYQVRSGQEARVYPLIVMVTQYQGLA